MIIFFATLRRQVDMGGQRAHDHPVLIDHHGPADAADKQTSLVRHGHPTMSDAYAEFRDALHEVQRTSGLGGIRLGRLLGVSRDVMKSLLTGRRRPGLVAIGVCSGIPHVRLRSSVRIRSGTQSRPDRMQESLSSAAIN